MDIYSAILLIIGFGFIVGLVTIPLESASQTSRLYDALVNILLIILGALLGIWIAQVIGLTGYARSSSIIVAVVLVLMRAGVRRFRRAQRDADERAGGRADRTQPSHPQPTQAAAHKLAAPSARAPRRIFISYRREDGAAQAGRIADLLGNEFGPDYVFMDVDAVRLGADFVKVINEEVAKCDVLLALIGRNWLAGSETGQPLLDNPADFVRLEIAAALQRQISVIPILIDGAKMPPGDRLPAELQILARHNALDLRHVSFKADMDRLVRELKASEGS